MNTVVSLSSLVSHRAFAFPFPPHAISTDTDALAPEWHMVAPPAGHHSRRERLGERARTTWGWATDQHLYMTPAPRAAAARVALNAGTARRRWRRRNRMHPVCYCPARRRPTFPSGAVLGAVLMAGSDPPKGKWTDFE